MSHLKAAILIVSETAAKDASSDKCGDVLKDVFHNDSASQWHVPVLDIVPDSILDVQRFIQRWADSEDAVNVIVTSGGTGFTTKDTTPERIKLAITIIITIMDTVMATVMEAMRCPEHTQSRMIIPSLMIQVSVPRGATVRVPEPGSFKKGIYPVALVSHAQAGEIAPLEEGKIARITTGAPLPPHASAVVMVEDTVLESMTDDGKEEKEIKILTSAIKPGENVREVGSDVRAGDVIMKAGEGITAVGGELGLLASVGVREVKVYKKPVVGVLSTGDEIVEFDRPGELRLGEVRDTNRPTLLNAVRSSGFEAVDLKIASDQPGSLEETLRLALRRVDAIITSGGVSMGELDLLKPTIERQLGGTIHFGRVSMKPGKPTTFATVPFKSTSGGDHNSAVCTIFSLPGNPASAVTTFQLFVLPSLHRASGISPAGLPRVRVRVDGGDLRCDGKRAEYHRALVVVKADGGLHASSTGGQRSSRIGSFKGANALLCLPVKDGYVKNGEMVDALMMGPVISEL
ncbi:hypothetical protein SLS55_008771 [Diplodia seriata]|uniref:MoaB/Mog domain-containing protein n=1 Tax=Diplodia seriata TaxID=420778 RepID=A0ABR3C6U9_9PEZI